MSGVLIMAAAAWAVVYVGLMGWICRGAFCSQYGESGVFDRLVSWSWGLFDRPAAARPENSSWQSPAEDVVAASTAALAATTLYTLISRPGAARVIDHEARALRNLLAAMRDAA